MIELQDTDFSIILPYPGTLKERCFAQADIDLYEGGFFNGPDGYPSGNSAADYLRNIYLLTAYKLREIAISYNEESIAAEFDLRDKPMTLK